MIKDWVNIIAGYDEFYFLLESDGEVVDLWALYDPLLGEAYSFLKHGTAHYMLHSEWPENASAVRESAASAMKKYAILIETYFPSSMLKVNLRIATVHFSRQEYQLGLLFYSNGMVIERTIGYLKQAVRNRQQFAPESFMINCMFLRQAVNKAQIIMYIFC